MYGSNKFNIGTNLNKLYIKTILLVIVVGIIKLQLLTFNICYVFHEQYEVSRIRFYYWLCLI